MRMKRANWILAVLAVAVLMVTLSLVGWLRQRVVRELNNSVVQAVASYDRGAVLHGPGGDTLVDFEAAEQLAQTAKTSPYIKDVIVTKRDTDDYDIPIVPFELGAEDPQWPKQVKGWTGKPLGDPDDPWGYLYFDLDRSVLWSINVAIVAIGLAIALMLVTLLARVWSQESSLVRTTFELRERRQELIRLERLAMGGQLAAGLIHDLRKPVLNIKHNLDEILEALGDFADAATALQDLRKQTRLFFQILADTQLERFVQSDRAEEEYVDVAATIDFALKLVQYEQRGVEIERHDVEGLPPILAHPFRLVQLFSNLILNAYQALDGKGRLTIATETDFKSGDAVIRFTDEGCGIEQDVVDRIFDPFFTTKPEGEGTGLGLSICRLIVEEMEGEIVAESPPGGPTTFRIQLPLQPGTQS